MVANHHPDGLTAEDITALQQAVDNELRREGHTVPEWPEPPCLPLLHRRSRRRPDIPAPARKERA